jgi:hypothetical protein
MDNPIQALVRVTQDGLKTAVIIALDSVSLKHAYPLLLALLSVVIQENSERWTLMIDPQMQGNNWLRDTYGSMEESQLQIIKPTTDSKIMTRKLD